MLRAASTTLAFFTATMTFIVAGPHTGISQDLPAWAEPAPPPTIERRSPKAQPSYERSGRMSRGLRSPPSTRGKTPVDRVDPESTGRLSPPDKCTAGSCPPRKVCCRKGGGGLKCRPEKACKPEEEVPLSPLATFMLSLFGAGYGAYRLSGGKSPADPGEQFSRS